MTLKSKNEIITAKTTKFDKEANRREQLLKYKPDNLQEYGAINDLYLESINAKLNLI